MHLSNGTKIRRTVQAGGTKVTDDKRHTDDRPRYEKMSSHMLALERFRLKTWFRCSLRHWPRNDWSLFYKAPVARAGARSTRRRPVIGCLHDPANVQH